MPWTFYNASGEAMIEDGAMSIANNTDDRVVTATGADPASLNGEANLTFDGTDLTVGAGNVIIGTAGKGIDFSAQSSPAAGMTSELLDRYEEGTFTAQITDDADDGSSASYVRQTGFYTRIGQQVLFHLHVICDAISGLTGSEQLKIIGLPFTVNNATGHNPPVMGVRGEALAITAGVALTGTVLANTTTLRMEKWSATTGVSALTVTEFSADGNLLVNGSYFVA